MSFIDELKRRNVFRVGVAYVVVAWLVLQVVGTVVPILELPNWIAQAALLFIAVGFVVSLILAWAYELTPEGVKSEKDVDRSQSITHVTGRKLDFAIIGVLAIALAFFALDRFVWNVDDTESVSATSDLEKSIAVLPFANRSALPEDAYFVDGIHDDIVAQLHKISAIDKVISRTTMERYRNTNKSIPEIAKELGIATVLEGSVQRAGSNVRINVLLIDGAEDEHLWTGNYVRELTVANIFAIQSEIAIAVADSLQASLSESDANQLSNVPTQDLEAYDKYLLGKQALAIRTLDDLRQARQLFEDAVSLDPTFSLAYVGLADTINLLVVYGEFDDENPERWIEARNSAEAAANRALTLNDQLGEAYASLGWTNWFRGELIAGEENLKKAIALSPNYVHAYRWYAHILWDTNRPKEALDNMLRGVALDPLDLITQVMLGEMFDINGRGDEALASYKRTLEIDEDYLSALEHIVYHYDVHGEPANAIIWTRKLLQTYPSYHRAFLSLALSYRSLGDVEQAEIWSNRVLESGNTWASAFVKMLSDYDKHNNSQAVDSALQFLEIDSSCSHCKMLIVNLYIIDEKPDALIEFLKANTEELLDEESPAVTTQNVSLVPALAWAFQEIGKKDQANRLIEIGLQIADHAPRQAVRDYGVGITDVKLLAVAGRRRDAINTLRSAVSEGGKAGYVFDLKDPTLASISSEPEFMELQSEIEAEVAAQLRYVQELEGNGELAPLPEQYRDPK